MYALHVARYSVQFHSQAVVPHTKCVCTYKEAGRYRMLVTLCKHACTVRDCSMWAAREVSCQLQQTHNSFTLKVKGLRE